jgi:putative transposase
MPQERYRKAAGGVSNLNYHFVWCVKYRKEMLVDGVDVRLKQLILEKAAALGVTVAEMEVMPDHVHLFVSAPPTDAPQHYANQFKGYTSRVLRQEFPHLKMRLPALWSRSYYVGAAGNVSASVIKRYIENQKGRE